MHLIGNGNSQLFGWTQYWINLINNGKLKSNGNCLSQPKVEMTFRKLYKIESTVVQHIQVDKFFIMRSTYPKYLYLFLFQKQFFFQEIVPQIFFSLLVLHY